MFMEVLKKQRTITIIVIAIIIISTIGWYIWDYNRVRIVLATTTSTYDSGLLDLLIPKFESLNHVYVDIISIGTGQAIATAEAGDADVILVHAKSRELTFVASGYGYHRIGVMYNDYIIVGPSSDPANIKGLNNATEAFIRIMNAGREKKCFFLSRGDGSGTHTKELNIWISTGTELSGIWYQETGQGMGTTLTMSNELQAYTLTDRGTWISWKDDVNLEILTEGDIMLANPYAVIPVDPAKHPHVKNQLAIKFVQFLISIDTQKIIENFEKEGEVLFKPIARNIQLSINLDFTNQEQELNWYDSQ
jgi:tungstate transport system substrate-binding protein